MARQEVLLHLGLNAFGNHRQLQALGQHNNGSDDGHVIQIGHKLAHKHAVATCRLGLVHRQIGLTEQSPQFFHLRFLPLWQRSRAPHEGLPA